MTTVTFACDDGWNTVITSPDPRVYRFRDGNLVEEPRYKAPELISVGVLRYKATFDRMFENMKANRLGANADNLEAAEAELVMDMPSMAEHFNNPANLKFLVILPPKCSTATIAHIAELASPVRDRLFFSYGIWVEKSYKSLYGPSVTLVL